MIDKITDEAMQAWREQRAYIEERLEPISVSLIENELFDLRLELRASGFNSFSELYVVGQFSEHLVSDGGDDGFPRSTLVHALVDGNVPKEISRYAFAEAVLELDRLLVRKQEEPEAELANLNDGDSF